MLRGPHEPYSKEVLEIVEQRIGNSETLIGPNRGLTRSSHHKARAVQADAGQARSSERQGSRMCVFRNRDEQDGVQQGGGIEVCPTNSPVVGIDALGEGQLRRRPLNHSNQGNL